MKDKNEYFLENKLINYNVTNSLNITQLLSFDITSYYLHILWFFGLYDPTCFWVAKWIAHLCIKHFKHA